MGWKGRILGQVIIFCLYAFITLYILYRKKYLQFGYNKAYIKKALRFGVPLIPHTFGGAALMLADRFIITHVKGVTEVGIYMVGFQFAQIIMLVQDSVNSAFAPWIYKNLRNNSHSDKRRLVKVTYWYFLGIFMMAILYSLLVPPFFKIFVGREFAEGVQFIFWISLGFAFNGMYKMVVNYIFFVEKTYVLAFITTFCAVCNISLTYFLVNLHGTLGAAHSLCISYALSFILTWYFSNRVYPMPWALINDRKL
jgi:O-antigen/teichoic acid export membrane protein